MPHSLDLILTLTGGLTGALILGLLAQRLHLSPIVGYLAAGIAVGPFTPGFVGAKGIAEELAELGVILLLFGVGLHFRVKEVLGVWRVAVPGALSQIAATTVLTVFVTRAFGWSVGAGVVFGLAISVASTVVLLRVLSDHDDLQTPSGHVTVGWLLVEDLFTVLVLVMLPLVAAGRSGGGSSAHVALTVGVALLKLVALVVFTLVVGRRVIPALLRHVERTRSRELFTLTVLVIALGVAVSAAEIFGASMALGAFLAGVVVGQSDFSSRAASDALPMRDAFAVLFFVAMGMLLDPSALAKNLGLTLGTLAVILIGKPLVALLLVLALHRPARIAVSAAFALAEIGEFSFILTSLGRQLGVLPEMATQTVVVAAIVSIALNPPLYHLVEPASDWLSARLSRRGNLRSEEASAMTAPPPAHRTILVGYGPVGRALARLLKDGAIDPMVIEKNYDTVTRLRHDGFDAVYGDAAQHEILERAGIRDAECMIYAASGSPEEVIRAAKDLKSTLHVVARATHVAEVEELKHAGADFVVAADSEVVLGMAEDVMHELGATAEQLDRARDHVRSEWPG